jgi:hypothetical protein
MMGPVIKDVWTLVSAAYHPGQANGDVHIFPCVVSQKALEGCAESKHLALWTDLIGIGDDFDQTKVLPIVPTNAGRYVVVG